MRCEMSKIGVVFKVEKDTDIFAKMKEVKAHGFACCQIVFWDMSMYTDKVAEDINSAVAETGIEVSTLWAGWSGAREWNFTAGPMTLGLVPTAYCMQRTKEHGLLGSLLFMLAASDFEEFSDNILDKS